MENRTDIEVVKSLLKAKDGMEQQHDFVQNKMRIVKDKNPATKLRVVQLNHGIQRLKLASGESKKLEAANLVRALAAPPKSAPKSIFCSNCGTRLTPGATFCVNCGTKVAKFKM